MSLEKAARKELRQRLKELLAKDCPTLRDDQSLRER